MKILFAGDFSVQDRSKKIFKSIDSGVNALSAINPICSQHDLSIVNFESPVTNCMNPIVKDGPNLKNPLLSINVLKEIGFGLFTLANNHLNDYGEQGVLDTIGQCKATGVMTVGASKNLEDSRHPFIYTKDNIKLAIINVCENEFSIAKKDSAGAAPLDLVDLYYTINRVRTEVNYVIVIIHGGREHYPLPTPRMKKQYRYIADLGADFIVNHHQHCYSGYEVYNGVPIFYGLGNFYFDNPKKRNCIWNKGLLLSVEFGKDVKWELIPFEQCNENPDIRLLPIETEKKNIDKLNGIISNDNLLEASFEELVKKILPLSAMQPYTNHYVRALYHRHLLPNLISKKKLFEILNSIRCQTHREVVIEYLENKLS
jgi:poly-gamma-glutamate synthesis protein (capsule biosynthesis protein)